MSTHDPNAWHAWDGTHHHGVNPETLLPIFGEPLEDFLDAGYFLSPPWATGDPEHPEEHEGYIALYDHAVGLEIPQKGKLPIEHIVLFIHSLGNAPHFLKRFHSCYAFLKVQGGGVIGLGGHLDYGPAHWQYKETGFIPPLPTDPPGMLSEKMLEQQPYRANTREFDPNYHPEFWSGQVLNPIAKPFFSPVPQNMLGVGWSTNAKEFFGFEGVEDIQVAHGIDGNRRFQIFNVQLQNLPAPRPFTGFTTRYQYLTAAPGPVGVDKVPITITKEVPLGKFSFYRRVGQGDETKAPILEF